MVRRQTWLTPSPAGPILVCAARTRSRTLEPIVKRTAETNQRSSHWSPGCALSVEMRDLGVADGHVRPQYRSTLFASRASAAV